MGVLGCRSEHSGQRAPKVLMAFDPGRRRAGLGREAEGVAQCPARMLICALNA